MLRFSTTLCACLVIFVSKLQVFALEPGHQPEAKVTAATGIDWVFAVSNQSPAAPPEDWLKGYDSAEQTFELYVPRGLKKDQGAGLIRFISPSERGSGLEAFRKVCDEQKLLFASPHKAGNNTDTKQRVRIVLDVLDEVRRQQKIDPDRTYIGGFSGGGRIACAIGFSLPEYFGGVIPVCAAGDLRDETWLQQRVIDRLSVAHLTGESDFNRGEVERFRGPLLAAVGGRSKVFLAPKSGHAIPPAALVSEAVRWLDSGVDARRKLAKEYPASRVAGDSSPSREELAAAILKEGKSRVAQKKTTWSGLMQLKGVLDRWPDLPAADEAKKLLLAQEQAADQNWQEEDVAWQRKLLIARAKALSDYATGPLPQQYSAQRPDMAKAAISMWQQILGDGQDKAAVAEGEKRLPELNKLLEK